MKNIRCPKCNYLIDFKKEVLVKCPNCGTPFENASNINVKEYIDKYLKEAKEFYDKKEYDNALNKYLEVLDIEETTIEANVGIITCFDAYSKDKGMVKDEYAINYCYEDQSYNYLKEHDLLDETTLPLYKSYKIRKKEKVEKEIKMIEDAITRNNQVVESLKQKNNKKFPISYVLVGLAGLAILLLVLGFLIEEIRVGTFFATIVSILLMPVIYLLTKPQDIIDNKEKLEKLLLDKKEELKKYE